MVHLVSTMKSANSKAIKNQESISQYEQKIIDEELPHLQKFQVKLEEPVAKEIKASKDLTCTKGHQLKKVFNTQKHFREVVCFECSKKIKAGPKPYLSCYECSYNLCRQCSFGEIIESVKSVSKPSRSEFIARLSSPTKKREMANKPKLIPKPSLIPILEDKSD